MQGSFERITREEVMTSMDTLHLADYCTTLL